VTDHAGEARRLLAAAENVRTHEERVGLLLKAQVHATLAVADGSAAVGRGAPGPALRDQLWTIDEASRELGIPATTLRYWRARGEGPPAIKLGGLLRYRRSAALAWIEASEEKRDDD